MAPPIVAGLSILRLFGLVAMEGLSMVRVHLLSLVQTGMADMEEMFLIGAMSTIMDSNMEQAVKAGMAGMDIGEEHSGHVDWMRPLDGGHLLHRH